GLSWRQGGGFVKNPDRPYLETEDLDELPFPARHLIKNELYTAPDTGEPITMINVGRGCPHQCIYCAVTVASGRKLKVRSPGNVVDEIEECVRRHGIKNFFFRADTFTWNEAWTVEVCRGILERGLKIRWGTNSRVDTISETRLEWMKRAGCWVVGYGFESGNEESLKHMKKCATLDQARTAVRLTHAAGIRVYGLFLIGLPWEDRLMIEDTIRFMKELDPDFVDVNIAYPLPGTEFYQMAEARGLFDRGDLGEGDYATPIARTEHLGPEDLKALRRKAVLGFYLRPRVILRTIAQIRSLKILMIYLTAAARVFRHHLFRGKRP
ncbi:MAG: radical SAM protein, partial [Candidatus Omnitrophica bacterium]|nr:radical SAM protein [Candidatus Omnitrophota bacterium]